MTDYIPSNAELIKFVNVNQSNAGGYERIDYIPALDTCWVAFGGELTHTEREARTYVSALSKLFTQSQINGVNLYSVMYEFNSRNAQTEREMLFAQAGRKMDYPRHPKDEIARQERIDAIRAHEPNPQYITKLFNAILRPRITTKDGKKLSTSEAFARIGNIKFYAHCHGATTIIQIANMMHDEMLKLGYTARDIKTIQQNLLVIQHAPIAPLENPRFTTLSFGSADDTQMNHHNLFSQYLLDNSADVFPSYFNTLGAHVFVSGRLKTKFGTEHDPKGFLDTDSATLTPDGAVIFAAERNALINGTLHTINGGKMPSVKELVSGPHVDFDNMKNIGDYISQLMTQDIRQQIQERANQK